MTKISETRIDFLSQELNSCFCKKIPEAQSPQLGETKLAKIYLFKPNGWVSTHRKNKSMAFQDLIRFKLQNWRLLNHWKRAEFYIHAIFNLGLVWFSVFL